MISPSRSCAPWMETRWPDSSSTMRRAAPGRSPVSGTLPAVSWPATDTLAPACALMTTRLSPPKSSPPAPLTLPLRATLALPDRPTICTPLPPTRPEPPRATPASTALASPPKE